MNEIKITKIENCIWEIPKTGKMRVPGRVYASDQMMDDIRADQSLQQVVNVAQLPGILLRSMAMPDIHWGYGFPIGGVAAFDLKTGIISPGGVGYDINCGVRLMRTNLFRKDVEPKVKEIVASLFQHIPSGVGSKGVLKLSSQDERSVLCKGARWAVENGYGDEADLEYIEENGQMPHADPATISQEALKRGSPQLGTLGSGNHFVEIDFVEEIYDDKAARVFGLAKDQIVIIVHTGSRGFGHQVCDDYIRKMLQASQKYGIELPDKQLCCAPFDSPEGQEYFAAMNCAINYAFANRQVISHWVREAFVNALNISPREAGVELVYELAHNIAKLETHTVNGKEMQVIVHRKGATRAFGPGHPQVPAAYREVGQPVLIPGDMGRYSYVLAGTKKAMQETFGSSCHGAGRRLSRRQAIKSAKGRAIHRELADRGIYAMAASRATMIEEIPEAYKDVSDVVEAVAGAGIGKMVVKLHPIGVIKG
ncbi:RNA-splicing ligase RtcB [candidate division KSB1 bacterium]|nr:MAG: RNA-splicing ligase RtcB [candidate division KSB1 bacterium]